MIKKHKVLFSIFYFFLSYILFFLLAKKTNYISFSYDLLIIFTIINVFTYLHFILNIKKMYDFIYKKRYILGLLLLSFLVFFKYNGSSTYIWNSIIEPEYNLKNTVILGKTRMIRSDEWIVSTPETLTQATKYVNFSKHNKLLRGTDNLVTLFPNLPSKDISILSMPQNIGYFFLDTERAFSLSWYLPYFILFFASFELFMIMTKKKKIYSLTGAILVTLAPVIQWWQHATIPAYGALAIVLFDKFAKTESKKRKLLISLLFGYTGFLYIMCLYPAWQVPYGYAYLILLIWIFIQNKDKLRLKDLLYLIPVLLIITIPTYLIINENSETIKLVTSTAYPGSRNITGGHLRIPMLFMYTLSLFYPYIDIANPCELSQYISLFPIPLFLSLSLIKKKKKDIFLMMSSALTILLVIWTSFKVPGFISKITLLNNSTEIRTSIVIGYISVIQLIYILSNYSNKFKKLEIEKTIKLALFSLLMTALIVKLGNKGVNMNIEGYTSLNKTLVMFLVYLPVVFLILYNNKKTNKILCFILIFISVLSGLLVSPLNRELDVFYDKPFSKEIKKIVSKNKNAVFLSADGTFFTGNYIAVNGGKTINTVNNVPNLKLFKKIDKKNKNKKIYNRYAHISVDLTDKETKFKLITDDYFNLKLSYDDVCKLNVDYIETKEDIDRYEKIYGKYDINIYKTNCK